MQRDSTPLNVRRLTDCGSLRDRVLIVGAGMGLDLDFVPSNVHVAAIDVTPAMLKHLERRAAGTGR